MKPLLVIYILDKIGKLPLNREYRGRLRVSFSFLLFFGFTDKEIENNCAKRTFFEFKRTLKRRNHERDQ